jgi:hypothetical protein
MIGGKIAPRPSDLTSRSWIQDSQTSSARLRNGVKPATSARFSHRSIRVKKPRHDRSRRLRGTCVAVRGTCSSGIAA